MKKGRPSLYNKKMKQTAIWLPDEMITWLKKQGNVSETVRNMVKNAMTNKIP